MCVHVVALCSIFSSEVQCFHVCKIDLKSIQTLACSTITLYIIIFKFYCSLTIKSGHAVNCNNLCPAKLILLHFDFAWINHVNRVVVLSICDYSFHLELQKNTMCLWIQPSFKFERYIISLSYLKNDNQTPGLLHSIPSWILILPNS